LKCTPFVTIDIDLICPLSTNELFPFCNIESDPDFFEAISARAKSSLTDHNLLHELKYKMKCDFTSYALTTPDLASNATQMFMHINARSLSKNIDSIITELGLPVDKPTVIAITETWAISDSDNLPILGYTNILKARTYKAGGGVGLYLKDYIGLNYKLRMDLSINNKSDSLFIQLVIQLFNAAFINIVQSLFDKLVPIQNVTLKSTEIYRPRKQ
jgi:hypothetical protein